ncbi:uncharacterized protein LOC122037921 isoform X2 [Zingiber officinale]|uniref:uncharacterized protein LOC122037921 isoform X2 n=1 Tax=Zingiber officinale TaxID=94328 RepID=UPI001C4C35D1|nr:uncharacterized protein LOC122037921 isoform X2 [Zingiber officinale]
MAFGTVSFEELLGHCNEVFKNNQRCTVDLEKRMQSLGYVTKVELEDEEILDDSKFTSPVSGFQRPFFEFVSVSVVQLSKKGPEEYILLTCNLEIENRFKLVESRVEDPIIKYLRQLCLDIQNLPCMLQIHTQ